jgi:tripeptide aminopeptidase
MKSCVEKFDGALNWKRLPDIAAWVIQQAMAIQQIPAPTFDERARASYVAGQFAALGLTNIETDDVFNVYGLLPGGNRTARGVMLSAHTDTIFAQDTDLKTRAADALIYGAGLGDNSIGVAGLLGLAWTLQQEELKPECDLWFVATTREEGLGDLGGMKAAFARLKSRVACVVNLEGLAFGHIYHAGIAVRRLRIAATTQGGHSWLHFGRTSAVHAILQLGARITTIHPPQAPRTTYNIGMIEGGQAINAIATSAELWLDMRSEQPSALDSLEAKVRTLINTTTAPDLKFTVEVVGDRPAGRITPDNPLVQGALAALERLSVRGTLENGSTDANVPLAQGCPAVTIGITRGGNAHRLDEYIETAPVQLGMRQLITLALGAAAYQNNPR